MRRDQQNQEKQQLPLNKKPSKSQISRKQTEEKKQRTKRRRQQSIASYLKEFESLGLNISSVPGASAEESKATLA